MLFIFIKSLTAPVQVINGNTVRHSGHLRLYWQPDYGHVRRISPSDVPEDWKCTKALCTLHRIENEPLRTVSVLTSDKELIDTAILDYDVTMYTGTIDEISSEVEISARGMMNQLLDFFNVLEKYRASILDILDEQQTAVTKTLW
ncbi:hypothetical protein AnigIFM49718_001243 [Aspergillus niger]|nr:hypothetical protein AnigIFM49718_001243 [Aspergillus niger]